MAKVKVIRVRADGPGAVKDRCWAWTEGPERPGDRLRWLTPGDIDKCKCTWRSDRVDQVKTANGQVEQRLWNT